MSIMGAILTKSSLLLLVFLFSSAFLTIAIELYSETDQLAEESFGGPEEGHEGEAISTSSPRYPLEEARDEKPAAEESSDEDEANDPLQKILPKVRFNCKGKSEGYYADNEFCELFHYCKTNGFRFTFMCPTDSYYNDKLMACEFNKTLSNCVNNRHKTNGTQNIVQNGNQEVRASAGQRIEVIEKSSTQYKTTTEKPESTTTPPTKVSADPYLTKWKANQRTTKLPETENKVKDKSSSPAIEKQVKIENPRNEIERDVESKVTTTHTNLTQTILPFRGFRRHNRTKFDIKTKNYLNQNRTDQTNIKITTPENNSSDSSAKVPSNAMPVLNSIRHPIFNNMNQNLNQRFRNRVQTTTTTTTSTTTPSPPSLLMPTTRGPTTVSPFDTYFTPIFNSDTSFPLNSDFFPLSLQRRPESLENNPRDRQIQRKSPVMTQNFFNTIHHNVPNMSPSNRNSQIREKQMETKQNPQFSQFFSSVMNRLSDQLPNRNNFNRAAVYDQQNIFNYSNPKPESLELDQLEDMSVSHLVENFRETDTDLDTDSQESEVSEVEDLTDPNESLEELEESEEVDRKGKRGKRKSKPKRVLTVPLLVPTGISKRELRRRLSATLLKPTVIPSPVSGQKMPAYILQFQDSDRSRKVKHNKHRSKRQAFNWNNPFVSNQFTNYYHPMSSIGSPVYSHFDNFVSNAMPMRSHNERQFLQIGERPTMRMNAMAQQNIPSYYSPPKPPHFDQNMFGPNFYKDNNVYDLSEFSDNFYDNPFNKRPPMMSNEIPYRSVSLKRPAFRRPPRRQRIPVMKSDRNITKKMELRTTVRPFNQMPVSPRPYSQPISAPKHDFYPSFNSNPFTDFGDDSISNAIKAFDTNDDNLQPFDSNFDSTPIMPFETPRTYSSDFIPITPKVRSIESSLYERSSRISPFSQPPINSFDNNFLSNSHLNFPPIPKFGDPEYRSLPFIDISENIFNNKENTQKKESVDQKQTNGTRYPTPYVPEVVYDRSSDTNETDRNPNHNYDNSESRELLTARTDDSNAKFGPLIASTLNWDNIVGHYNKQNVSIVSDNKSDEKELKNNQNLTNETIPYITYGTRLRGSVNRYSQNPEISVRASVSVSPARSVGSMQSEASNQVMVSRKLGSDSDLPEDKRVNDINNNDIKHKNIDELYNQRAFDRIMLFNYYNHLNSQKPKTSMTTTASPVDNKYPSTAEWSIRDWTGQYYTTSSTTTTTPAPVITINSVNIEPIDLFESEAIKTETTTESSQTSPLPRPEPPYKKIFNSHMGATFHSLNSFNKFNKPIAASEKTRSEISSYLSSLTSTTLKTI